MCEYLSVLLCPFCKNNFFILLDGGDVFRDEIELIDHQADYAEHHRHQQNKIENHRDDLPWCD